MAERWRSADVQKLLQNKYVVIIGDSIQRGLYKDLVAFLQSDSYLDNRHLKSKGEKSHCGDRLIEGGAFGEMTNSKSYREVRQYHTDCHLLTFYMVTRCYSEYMETVLADLSMEPRPDIVIMNSCLWDITRYGPRSMAVYQQNLQKFVNHLNRVLPRETLFLWNTALPVSRKISGGFMLPEISFMHEVLRLDVLEANYYAHEVMVDHSYDVLDLHFHFRTMIHLRIRDGVHWNPQGNRKISNLVLDHIANALEFPLPRNNWRTIEYKLPVDRQKQNKERYGQPIKQLASTGTNGHVRLPHQRSYTVDDSFLNSGRQISLWNNNRSQRDSSHDSCNNYNNHSNNYNNHSNNYIQSNNYSSNQGNGSNNHSNNYIQSNNYSSNQGNGSNNQSNGSNNQGNGSNNQSNGSNNQGNGSNNQGNGSNNQSNSSNNQGNHSNNYNNYSNQGYNTTTHQGQGSGNQGNQLFPLCQQYQLLPLQRQVQVYSKSGCVNNFVPAVLQDPCRDNRVVGGKIFMNHKFVRKTRFNPYWN